MEEVKRHSFEWTKNECGNWIEPYILDKRPHKNEYGEKIMVILVWMGFKNVPLIIRDAIMFYLRTHANIFKEQVLKKQDDFVMYRTYGEGLFIGILILLDKLKNV